MISKNPNDKAQMTNEAKKSKCHKGGTRGVKKGKERAWIPVFTGITPINGARMGGGMTNKGGWELFCGAWSKFRGHRRG